MKKYTYDRVMIENGIGKVIDENGNERDSWGVELEDDDIPIGFEESDWGRFVVILRPVLSSPRKRPKSDCKKMVENKIIADKHNDHIDQPYSFLRCFTRNR